MKKKVLNLYNKKGAKLEDLEGPLVKRFYRTLAIYFTEKVFIKTKLTPNQITFISFFGKLIAAYLFSFGIYPYIIYGSVVLFIAYLLDYIDGTLARMRGIASDFGRFIDLGFDEIGKVVLFFAIAYGFYSQTHNSLVWIFALLGLTASQFLAVLYISYRWLFKFAVDTIEKEKKKRRFLVNFFYLEHNILNGIILAGILNLFYYMLIFYAFYGWVFALVTFVILLKKSYKLNIKS